MIPLEVFQALPQITYPMLFIMGSALGSFYFNLTYRITVLFYTQERKKYRGWSRWQRLLLHPSHCEECEEPISGLGLVPILGYTWQKGQCPHCGYSIPLIYPLGELIFGMLACSVFFLTDNPFLALVFCAFTGHLIISAYTDFRFFSLDYENLIWIFLWGFLFVSLWQERLPGREDFYVLLGFGGFFTILYLFYPKGIGFGDVLFAPVFAFLAGHPWWMFFLNATYIPAVIVAIVFRKKDSDWKTQPIPMGIYFGLGIFLTLFARMIYQIYYTETIHYE